MADFDAQRDLWRLPQAAGETDEVMMKDWRRMLTEVGGYDNALIGVPAGAVREMIDEIDALRAAVERVVAERDALKAQIAVQAVPVGWKLVPEMPSEQMVLRGVEAQVEKLYAAGDPDRVEDVRWVMTRACYSAMLAAAPEGKP
jgi:hypothetical protein